GINLGEDSVLGFHLVGILAFSLSTQIFFFLATLVLSGFDPLVSVSQLSAIYFSFYGVFVWGRWLFWFLCGNEVYTDSFFDKIVLKVLPDKHFTIP
ncbi:hypothetical protein PN487_10040, partial [Microcystis aeruginosa CS-556/03]|nr:hypothetical protein [Microcystis aeruginosa CS-556/03]